MVVGSWVSSNTKEEDIGSGVVDVSIGDGVGLFVTMGATVVVGTKVNVVVAIGMGGVVGGSITVVACCGATVVVVDGVVGSMTFV
jgi:hypothetical protein